MQGSISNDKTKTHFIMKSSIFHIDHSAYEDFGNNDGIGSSGSLNNPMYQNVCAIGTYEPQSGRSHRRYFQRERMKEARKQSYSYGKPRCKATNGFI